jgi:hypothetical protein
MKEVVEFTARNFDEIILDDFFFTDCKSDGEIQAKGDRSWTAYRLALMDQAGRELVVNPAKAVNPKVRVIIKYPNWYDHFQYLGFNLETEPKYFDKIYTGTETRDPVNGNQHLQQYHGYSVFRYFENIKPGGNAGGWVDQGGSYSRPLRGAVLAHAVRQGPGDHAVQYRLALSAQCAARNRRRRISPARPSRRSTVSSGELGKPVGVKTYKPYHSSGEDFLPSYLGMLGHPHGHRSGVSRRRARLSCSPNRRSSIRTSFPRSRSTLPGARTWSSLPAY